MSVIITGMDLPGRCDECPLALNSECPLIGIDTDEEEGSRDMNCPLKSADIVEELEKIKKDIKEVWSLNNERDMLLLASYIWQHVDMYISKIKWE